MRRLTAFVVAGCALLAAACGSGHKSASPTTTAPAQAGLPPTTSGTPTAPATTSPALAPTSAVPSPTTTQPSAQATGGVGDGTKYLAIVTPLTGALESAPGNPTSSQLDQLASEVKSAQTHLTALRWPGQAEADIRTLVGELDPLAADMAQGDAGAVSKAAATLASASVTIRLDLGLPSHTR